MHLPSIGVLRGVASAIGLLGTAAYHFSLDHVSLEATAMWSVTYETLCLLVSLSSFVASNNLVSIGLLVTGVCLSRIGLWVYDLSIVQMQQQEVPDKIRATVGGIQESLNSFCNLLVFGLGLCFADPKDFWIYVVTAVASVGTAALLFGWGVYWPRIRHNGAVALPQDDEEDNEDEHFDTVSL